MHQQAAAPDSPASATQADGLERLRAWLRGERAPVGLQALLGLRILAAERGRVVIAARPGADHLNSGGAVHGGFTAALLDTAMGCAAQSVVPAGRWVTTMELKASYHRRIVVETGSIEATGLVLSSGRRAVFAEAKILDEAGRLLASGSSTLMILER